jgi:glycosyltransferase involved in cell wall biosynthesis
MALNWGIKSEKVHLIFNSISTSRFKFEPNANKKYDVLSVCRLVPWKGLDEVVRVCSQLNLSLAIAGSGPEMDNLKTLAGSLNANVQFLGEISQEQLPHLYESSKFFVLNSNFEATSYSLLEARSCGVFSIANANTGSAEVISHMKDGILCGEETGMTIFDALKYASENPNFCNSAVTLARDVTVNEFDMNINFNKILKLVIDG